MDLWREILIAVLSAGGGAGALAAIRWAFSSDYRRTVRADADNREAEANAKEWELEEARIKQLHDTVGTLNDVLKTQAERIAAQNTALDAKTDRIRDLTDRLDASEQRTNRINAQLVEVTAENGTLKVLVEHYKLWHCRKGDCSDRQPPKPELKGAKYVHPKNNKPNTNQS